MQNDERLRILVVDDKAENLAAMARLLERPDLEILTAASGNEALGLMLDLDLALVLLDVQMPEMNGFEVAELMRRNERTRRVPVIFVTAINKERQQVFSGYEAGAVDYLFKPVDPFILRAKVNVFLEMKSAQIARERLVRELNRANNRLLELNERKSDYLAAASHELRTPLTVIKEHCSLVSEGLVGELTDEQRHCIGVALRNCNRLAALVDDLLDLNGIESGHTVRHRRPLDLAELLQTCVEDFRGTCGGRDQQLSLDAAPGLPRVLADPALLTQVVVNLLGNAHKFTPDGGAISVRARRTGGMVRLEIADSGPGVPAGDRDRIFEKFVRLDAPGSERRGSGLGLAIARRIVDLHGGAIGVDDGAEGGAVFHVTVPVCTEDGHLKALVADATAGPGGAHGAWSLVLLRLQGAGPVGPLAAAAGQALRRGPDRASIVSVGDRDHV
ncbi:MAG TPA: hybrid sensor histidine kinase/response regulator, partial [Candidatus Krumholzibacteria bacterium]|nr:hybrid sensor histidine kinase/response regulator [Candidatus Krumholzibacteria bacterium]